jgi:hypothetical protein
MMKGYSEFHQHDQDLMEELDQLDEISLRGATAAASFATILGQSQKLKMTIQKAKRSQHQEEKIDALADAMDLLSTKLTAVAALTYALSRKRR